MLDAEPPERREGQHDFGRIRIDELAHAGAHELADARGVTDQDVAELRLVLGFEQQGEEHPGPLAVLHHELDERQDAPPDRPSAGVSDSRRDRDFYRRSRRVRRGTGRRGRPVKRCGVT